MARIDDWAVGRDVSALVATEIQQVKESLNLISLMHITHLAYHNKTNSPGNRSVAMRNLPSLCASPTSLPAHELLRHFLKRGVLHHAR